MPNTFTKEYQNWKAHTKRLTDSSFAYFNKCKSIFFDLKVSLKKGVRDAALKLKLKTVEKIKRKNTKNPSAELSE